jgi:hypothetical protein
MQKPLHIHDDSERSSLTFGMDRGGIASPPAPYVVDLLRGAFGDLATFPLAAPFLTLRVGMCIKQAGRENSSTVIVALSGQDKSYDKMTKVQLSSRRSRFALTASKHVDASCALACDGTSNEC